MKKIQIIFLTAMIAAVLTAFSTEMNAQSIMGGHYKKALIIGAHPDDPESMCGGTMLMLKNQGCEVVCVYFTQGEGGIPGKSEEEARAIRHQEALNSCAYMGIRPLFMTQVDGRSEITKERYDEMKDLIAKENPDIVITHWPIDSHRDHRNCALLVFDSWRRLDHGFDLYFTEVMSGNQTLNFLPTSYVDITPVREQKIAAYLCHKSQNLEGNIAKYHDTMEGMRGREYMCQWAEAFVQVLWNKERSTK
ncbi:MAG: PIG-L family deacetylase [Bacteroidales bacterium]|nr:PIG-L family deacetylase [Candidatus Cacconaster caballi]